MGPGALRGRRIETREYGREDVVDEPRIEGAWRATKTGYVVEFRVPLSMIEFPHSTTRAIVSMLNAGTFVRFARIPFIFSHAGGTIPFLVRRIEGQARVLGKPGWRETPSEC